jgi:hypothetical protein
VIFVSVLQSGQRGKEKRLIKNHRKSPFFKIAIEKRKPEAYNNKDKLAYYYLKCYLRLI